MPEPFQKRIRKQTPLQKGPNPETAYSCTLWHDFPGRKPPQKPPKTLPKITSWRPKQAPEPLQKGPAKLYAKRYSLYPRTIQKVTPEGPTTGAKIHQKSHFGASGTPQLQPTGSRDAQEGVNHPNWSQKSSKNDPRTPNSRPKTLSEKPTACQKRGRRQWASPLK